MSNEAVAFLRAPYRRFALVVCACEFSRAILTFWAAVVLMDPKGHRDARGDGFW